MTSLTASRTHRTARWAGLAAVLSVLALLVAPVASAEPPAPGTGEGDPAVETVVAVTDPTITGEPAVGQTLSAAPPTWVPTEAATAFQWLRDGAVIPEAVGEQYTVVAADAGHIITVQATGTRDGYLDGLATSAATSTIALGTFTAVSPPMISGTARVGSTLHVAGPAWSIVDVDTSHQWLRAGKPITGATETSYVVGPADVGAPLAVRATGSLDGYNSTTVSSTATAAVTKVPAKVAVTGSSPRVGEVRLSIKVTATGEPPLSGTVRVKRGSTVLRDLPVKNGVAALTATKMPSGTHTYSVSFTGTSRVAGATGTARVTTKAKVKPTITLKGSATPGKAKLAITVTAPGQPPLGGAVSVKEGSKTLRSTLALSRGKATFSISGVKTGSHTYTVAYKGSSQVLTGSKRITIRVPAPPKLVSYANCAALQKVHPHGVGRSGARDKTSGTPVTTFLVNTKLYEYNDGKARRPGEKDLDRDNDGVACEKR